MQRFRRLKTLPSLSLVMTSIAQLIKASEYVCTGRYPVQASAVFLNELIISLSLSHTHRFLYLSLSRHFLYPSLSLALSLSFRLFFFYSFVIVPFASSLRAIICRITLTALFAQFWALMTFLGILRSTGSTHQGRKEEYVYIKQAKITLYSFIIASNSNSFLI